MAEYINVKIYDNKLTDHFALWEFAHKSGREIYIDSVFIYKFVPALEAFRVWYKRPINIKSGFRPKYYNDTIPGASEDCAHLRSWAVDFPLPADYFKMSKNRKEQFLQNVKTKWVDICHALGMFAQVNFYPDRLHLGMSEKKDNFLDFRGTK